MNNQEVKYNLIVLGAQGTPQFVLDAVRPNGPVPPFGPPQAQQEMPQNNEAQNVREAAGKGE